MLKGKSLRPITFDVAFIGQNNEKRLTDEVVARTRTGFENFPNSMC